MASSLTAALRTAQSGLLVNQSALDAVANNIANVNTKGYSRKTVNFEQRVVDGTGAGVQLSALTRQIDEGLLKSLRLELGNFNSLDVQSSFYDRLQDLFGAPADNSSISHIVTEFTASLESLAVAPNKTLELSEVLRQAQNTTLKLQSMSTTIQELRQQADNAAADIVTEINALVKRTGEFNDTLVRNSTSDRDVTDLKDQRDQALDRLSELIDIRYFTRSDGDVVVFTSNGRTLVDNIPATLTHKAASTVSATSTHAEGNISGIFVGTEIPGNDITDEIKAGQLKGLIDLLDTVLTDLQIQIDELAAQIRDSVNQIHNAGAPYPGMQSMTGSRSFVSPSTQTITLDPTNSSDDVTIALFDSNGDQTASTTLDTIMTSATYGTGAQTTHGAWTIAEVASSVQDWLRANGASSATAAVNSAGKFATELNAPALNLAFLDLIRPHVVAPHVMPSDDELAANRSNRTVPDFDQWPRITGVPEKDLKNPA